MSAAWILKKCLRNGLLEPLPPPPTVATTRCKGSRRDLPWVHGRAVAWEPGHVHEVGPRQQHDARLMRAAVQDELRERGRDAEGPDLSA